MTLNASTITQLIINRSIPINKHRDDLALDLIEERLRNNTSLIDTLLKMEETGGEPTIVDLGLGYKGITIVDSSPESPLGRRSLCYDQDAFDKRKVNKPAGTAISMAHDIGARLLTKEEYLALQKIIPIDQKSSSWLLTPPSIRDKGGAIYGESRFGEVFIGANGAESYFSSRGFRLILIIE